jgi:hypothetical protein
VARFLLAGFAAEWRASLYRFKGCYFAPYLYTGDEYSRDDFARASLLANPPRLVQLRVEVDLIVATNWHQVEIVARALLERRYLTGDEVYRPIRRGADTQSRQR